MNLIQDKDCRNKKFDIIEDIKRTSIPQQSQRLLDMYKAAQNYYKLLNDGGIVSERKKQLKDELDILRARFGTDGGDLAYYAFLDMERVAGEE